MKTRRKYYFVFFINIFLTIQVLSKSNNNSYSNVLISHKVKESKTIKNNNINIKISEDNYLNNNNNNATNNDDYEQYPDNSYYYDNYEESDSKESHDKDDEAFESLIDNDEFETNGTSNVLDESLDQIYEDYIFPNVNNVLNLNISNEDIEFQNETKVKVILISNLVFKFL